jgi:hypothetical protein
MRAALLVLAMTLSPVAMVHAEPASPPGIGFSGKREAKDDKPAAKFGDGRTSRGPGPIQAPAKGAAYNVVHIAYAAVIMLAMLAFVLWLIRRAKRERTD